MHDPVSPLLIGLPGDANVTERRVKSLKENNIYGGQLCCNYTSQGMEKRNGI